MILGLSSPGEDMKYYPDLPSRFVFIPRPNHPDPRAAIISVDADPFHVIITELSKFISYTSLFRFFTLALDINRDPTSSLQPFASDVNSI